ncbi:MAG TPA: penicillin-binding protein 2 [Steroidobacteraceae bacterium]|nr:penicillin-binding protein 2 [Steroidobacteraceae bacterium]
MAPASSPAPSPMRSVRIKDHWSEQRMFERRSLLAAALIALATLALCGRLFLLQVVRHDYYAQLSQGNRVRVEPIPAARGLMFDRNGAVLAAGQPAYQLELVREEVPDLGRTLRRLVAIGMLSGDDVPEVRRTILSRRSFDSVPIRLRMSDEDAARFAVHRFEFPGVDIKTRQTRLYPYGELAVHAIGYVGAISEQDLSRVGSAAYAGTTLIGKVGVEGAYETKLHGTNGFREVLVNAQGRSVDKLGALTLQLRTQPPVAGDNLVLSIDLKTQQVAEESLGDHRGAVVALDPSTGDVLAMVSHPAFDPNLFARGLTSAEYAALANDIDRPLLNRALRGTYPSGSTIKPVLALAALTDRAMQPDEKVFCNAVFRLPGSRHLWRADKDEPRGWLDMPEAISRSSDVYFYGLASKLGIERIDAFLGPFGYGRPTGIDIGGEKSGLLPTPEWKERVYKQPWFPGETVNLGIGQGYLLVTPLQLAHIAGILAERGRNFRPRLVTGMRDVDGRVMRFAPIEDKPILGVSDADWTVVINAMIGTTKCERYCGTAWVAFQKVAYTAAGKTGTAQVFTVAQNAHYNAKDVAERLRDHAWFIAFAPAEAPRIAVAVLVENAGFGASNAAPIARKVLDTYLLGPDGKLKPAGSHTLTPETADARTAQAAERSEERR